MEFSHIPNRNTIYKMTYFEINILPNIRDTNFLTCYDVIVFILLYLSSACCTLCIKYETFRSLVRIVTHICFLNFIGSVKIQ